jgi:hypothetical protein
LSSQNNKTVTKIIVKIPPRGRRSTILQVFCDSCSTNFARRTPLLSALSLEVAVPIQSPPGFLFFACQLCKRVTQPHTHTHTHTYPHKRTHGHTHTHTHIDRYMYTYIYLFIFVHPLSKRKHTSALLAPIENFEVSRLKIGGQVVAKDII